MFTRIDLEYLAKRKKDIVSRLLKWVNSRQVISLIVFLDILFVYHQQTVTQSQSEYIHQNNFVVLWYGAQHKLEADESTMQIILFI